MEDLCRPGIVELPYADRWRHGVRAVAASPEDSCGGPGSTERGRSPSPGLRSIRIPISLAWRSVLSPGQSSNRSRRNGSRSSARRCVDRSGPLAIASCGRAGGRRVCSSRSPRSVIGLGPIWSVVLFLTRYNVGHLAIRIWGFRRGWRDGLEVGRALREGWLKTVPRMLAPVILLLLGLDAVLLSREVLDVVGWHGLFAGLALVAAFVTLMAFRWPRRTGRIAVALVVLIPVMWFALATLNG